MTLTHVETMLEQLKTAREKHEMLLFLSLARDKWFGVLICNDENLFACKFAADRWIDRCHSMLGPVPMRVRAYQMIKYIGYLQKRIRNQRCIKQNKMEANVHEGTEKAVKN